MDTSSRAMSGPIILIVEDHAATRDAMTAMLLAALPGCRMVAADSAEYGLMLCEPEPPALVIMDIALPGMNGIEATRRIRALYPATQVVMHSNSDMRIFRDEAAAAGAAAFVSKRRTSAELVLTIVPFLPAANVRP